MPPRRDSGRRPGRHGSDAPARRAPPSRRSSDRIATARADTRIRRPGAPARPARAGDLRRRHPLEIGRPARRRDAAAGRARPPAAFRCPARSRCRAARGRPPRCRTSSGAGGAWRPRPDRRRAEAVSASPSRRKAMAPPSSASSVTARPVPSERASASVSSVASSALRPRELALEDESQSPGSAATRPRHARRVGPSRRAGGP